MKMDFSHTNLEYLIQARDLSKQDPALAAVLLDIPDEMACMLSELLPHQLTQILHIKPPLVIPRQEAWWWSRLFTALRDGRPEEIETIVEQASLLMVR